MAYQVFNPNREQGLHAFRGYSWTDTRHVLDLKRGGPRRRQVVELDPLTYRRWSWEAGMDETQRATWVAFLEAVGWTRDAFLLLDPRDPDQDQVALEPAAGDGARVTFSLPTVDTDPAYRWYPRATGVELWVNAVSVGAAAAVDTDARTVTYAVAPGVGLSVAASFTPLRLVHLVEAPEVRSEMQTWARYVLELQELVRDA